MSDTTAGAGASTSPVRRTPVWLIATIAGLLGLFYAYAVWNAIGNLVETIGFYGIGFYGAGERRENGAEAENIFYQHMEVYQSYWRDDPEFDCTNTRRALPNLPCPHVDRAMLRRLSQKAIDNRFSWRDPVTKKPAGRPT